MHHLGRYDIQHRQQLGHEHEAGGTHIFGALTTAVVIFPPIVAICDLFYLDGLFQIPSWISRESKVAMTGIARTTVVLCGICVRQAIPSYFPLQYESGYVYIDSISENMLD